MVSDMKHPRQLGAIIILYTFCLLHHIDIAHAYDYKLVIHQTLKNRGIPQGVTPILIQRTPTVIVCGRMCRMHWECFSFHAEKNIDNSWTCSLLSDRFIKADVPSGIGTFGNYVGYLTEYSSYPDVPGAQFLFETHVGTTEAAIYDCRKSNPSMGAVGIAYDYDADTWLTPSLKCADSICNQLPLSGTTLAASQTLSGNIQTIKTFCPWSNKHMSDVECDTVTGEMEFDYNPEVACVSEYCYRHDKRGKAAYKGELNVAVNGVSCQAWASRSSLVDDDFPEDDNVSDAANSCRDPDDTGYPWCYYTSGDDWERCEVPLCHWPVDIDWFEWSTGRE